MLRYYPDPILKESSSEVKEEDYTKEELKQICDDMFNTMRLANGIGIAAPQIGIQKRIIVLDGRLLKTSDDDDVDENGYLAMINPILINATGEVFFEEGCLSLPGYFTSSVKRSEVINIAYQTLNGEHYETRVSGFVAAVIQHEYDHLYGKMLLDHLGAVSRTFAKNKVHKNLRKLLRDQPEQITEE